MLRLQGTSFGSVNDKRKVVVVAFFRALPPFNNFVAQPLSSQPQQTSVFKEDHRH